MYDNVKKLIRYLSVVSVDTIIVDGIPDDIERTTIALSKNFFYTDSCVQCGKCESTVHTDLLFTESEYQKILRASYEDFRTHFLPTYYLDKLKSELVKEIHNINGSDKIFYTVHNIPWHEDIGPRGLPCDMCHYLFKEDGKYRCGIHPVIPINCYMPHLRFRCSKSMSINIGISQYGRNQWLGCPIKFSEPSDEAEFNLIKADRVDKLSRLQKISEDLNVPTYLPEILQYVNKIEFKNYKAFLNKVIVDTRHRPKFKFI